MSNIGSGRMSNIGSGRTNGIVIARHIPHTGATRSSQASSTGLETRVRRER